MHTHMCMHTQMCMHTDAGIRACTRMPTSAYTPHAPPGTHPGTRAHTHTPKRVPGCPQTQALRPGSFPCCVSPPRQGSPARLAAPCQLPWQCCACQEMKFALPRRGEGPRAAGGGPAVPAAPGSAHLPAPCGAAPGMSRLWLHQPSPGTGPSVLGSSCLTSCEPAVCRTRARVKESPLGGHLHPIMGGRLLPAIIPRSKPCPVTSRTRTAWTCPTVLPIPAQPLALPVVTAAPGICRAHQQLPAPLCRMHHCGLSSFNQSRDRLCWFPCRGDRLLPRHAMPRHATPRHATAWHATPCHAMPCHGSQQGRAEVEGGWRS